MKSVCLFRILLVSLALQWHLYGGAVNVALEDQIAKAVLSIRAEAHLPKLTRIKHREELQAWTCMAAERDTSLGLPSEIFRTQDPLSSPQLRGRAPTLGKPERRSCDRTFRSGSVARSQFRGGILTGILLDWNRWVRDGMDGIFS